MNSTGTSDSTSLTVINVLTYAILAVVTFGIAAGTDRMQVLDVVRKRKAVICVGLATQYLVVPSAARAVTAILQMPDLDAFGVVLLGCCPGGAVSNAFAYFARGDLALSVSMTTVSNSLAFGTLPLLLFVWTQGLASVSWRIPFIEIFISLLLVLIPAALGIWLRTKKPAWGKYAERLGAVGGAVLIVASLAAGLVQNRDTLSDPDLFPWKNAVAVTLVAPIGMLGALAAVALLRCYAPVPLPVIATVLLETGVQNTVLAIAIANLSTGGSNFTRKESFRLQLIMITWGVIVSFEALAATLTFRWMMRSSLTAHTLAQPSTQALPTSQVETTVIEGPS